MESDDTRRMTDNRQQMDNATGRALASYRRAKMRLYVVTNVDYIIMKDDQILLGTTSNYLRSSHRTTKTAELFKA